MNEILEFIEATPGIGYQKISDSAYIVGEQSNNIPLTTVATPQFILIYTEELGIGILSLSTGYYAINPNAPEALNYIKVQYSYLIP